jgi:hypothetical protein
MESTREIGAPIGDIPPHEMAEPYTFFTWGNPPFRVDILTRISGVAFDDAWSRRETYVVNEAAGLTAPVISAADLIVNKLASGQEPERLQRRFVTQEFRSKSWPLTAQVRCITLP